MIVLCYSLDCTECNEIKINVHHQDCDSYNRDELFPFLFCVMLCGKQVKISRAVKLSRAVKFSLHVKLSFHRCNKHSYYSHSKIRITNNVPSHHPNHSRGCCHAHNKWQRRSDCLWYLSSCMCNRVCRLWRWYRRDLFHPMLLCLSDELCYCIDGPNSLKMSSEKHIRERLWAGMVLFLLEWFCSDSARV